MPWFQTRSGMLERMKEAAAASERFLKHCWEDESGLGGRTLDGAGEVSALWQLFLLRRGGTEPQRSVEQALAEISPT